MINMVPHFQVRTHMASFDPKLRKSENQAANLAQKGDSDCWPGQECFGDHLYSYRYMYKYDAGIYTYYMTNRYKMI